MADTLKQRRHAILADRAKYAADRIAAIDETLAGRAGGPGPIRPRRAKPGNVSTYEHLQALRAEYALEPRSGGRVDRDLVELERQIADAEQGESAEVQR